VTTPAGVIGENVNRLRRNRMTAEEFGAKIGEIFGKPWPRQTVYLLEQGKRRLAAEEVVAISAILETPIADLFTPPAEVDQVQVGRRTIPREHFLTGQQAGEQLYEIARHVQALFRSMKELDRTVEGQRLVMANIENATRGKPPIEPHGEDWAGESEFLGLVSARLRAAYERTRPWYEPTAPLPEWLDPEWLKGNEE
jgi:hypothetical protein